MVKRSARTPHPHGRGGEERTPGEQLFGLADVLPLVRTSWRQLLFLNYEVPEKLLTSRLPSGTELDLHEGRALVSIVGFRFLGTRVLKLPVPGHQDFDEVNLRFYARRRVQGRWRTGVVFVRELVPRPAFAWFANALVNEHYLTLPMRHSPEVDRPGDAAPAHVAYEWQQGSRWQSMTGTPRGAARVPEEGSADAFLTVRHRAWSAWRAGSTVEHEVIHPRWKVWRVEDGRLDADVASLFGAEFSEVLSGPPWSSLLADGSEVVLHPRAWMPANARARKDRRARRGRPAPV